MVLFLRSIKTCDLQKNYNIKINSNRSDLSDNTGRERLIRTRLIRSST